MPKIVQNLQKCPKFNKKCQEPLIKRVKKPKLSTAVKNLHTRRVHCVHLFESLPLARQGSVQVFVYSEPKKVFWSNVWFNLTFEFYYTISCVQGWGHLTHLAPAEQCVTLAHRRGQGGQGGQGGHLILGPSDRAGLATSLTQGRYCTSRSWPPDRTKESVSYHETNRLVVVGLSVD